MSINDCINLVNPLIDTKLSLEICNCEDKSYNFLDGESRLLFVEKHEDTESLYTSIIQLPNSHYTSIILPKDTLVYLALTPILQNGLFNVGDKIHINTHEFIRTYYNRKGVLDDIDTGNPTQKLFEIYILKNTEIYHDKYSKDKNIVLPNYSVFKILNVKLLPFYGSSCICYRVLLCVK